MRTVTAFLNARILFACFFVFGLYSCQEPSDVIVNNEDQVRTTMTEHYAGDGAASKGGKRDGYEILGKGNSATTNRIIEFSGYRWIVRNSSSYTGSELNVFSNSANNVWVDAQGNLHLKITKVKGKWQCAEILSEQYFGYGDYIFETASAVDLLDKNVVCGLFTWNNNSFQSDANSEIDIEFAKWGYANLPTLQYTVQPSNGGTYGERDYKPSAFSLPGTYSTHGFSWTPERVDFKSYYGLGFPTSLVAGDWVFANTAQPRQKIQGGMTSDAVVIPAPGTTTRVHMNLWLNDSNFDGYGDGPSNGLTAEVIVKKFTFTPASGI